MLQQIGIRINCVHLFAICVAAFSAGCRKEVNDGASGLANSQEELMKGIVTVQPPDTPESLAAKKTKLEANLKKSIEFVARGNLEPAMKLLEESMSLDSKHRELLLQLVQVLRRRSRELVAEDPARSYRLMVSAGGYLDILQASHKDFTKEEKELFASVLFDEACAHARSNRYEEFTGAFNAAMGEGFSDLERLKSEPDLKLFREVPKLKEIIEKAEAEIAKHKQGA